MTDYGVDVSHHNDVQDWNAVHGNNISFVLLKVTESVDFVDAKSAAYADGARGAGIAAGGYHFARPVDVAAQVAHFADRLKERGLLATGSVWPALDMEANGFADPNAFVKDFIGQFRQRTGVQGMLVYANLNWWKNILKPDGWADDNVLLWIARYNGDPGNPGWSHPKLALHQHSSQGSVPGIAGAVDRNATVGSYGAGVFRIP
ncbi:glycoside hydrolase family 25 protein [Amycolatopsis anabasis]|uniref:glycoside hydrolase family 25 protein n=1 Tax=Amycolatopsis anabasis TaxID=1840409 RepID=UPI00131E5754|nr:glycoside hydrolase family 25 protein [Amycolatopsis anabasis]